MDNLLYFCPIQMLNMKDNALSVANYLIDLAKKENKNLTQLGLMKRVYIAHGFSLAINKESLLDNRFDKVEAWKYGPVIPSVYHSFKQYKAGPITEKAVVMDWDEKNCTISFPELCWRVTRQRKLSRWYGSVTLIYGCRDGRFDAPEGHAMVCLLYTRTKCSHSG